MVTSAGQNGHHLVAADGLPNVDVLSPRLLLLLLVLVLVLLMLLVLLLVLLLLLLLLVLLLVLPPLLRCLSCIPRL